MELYNELKKFGKVKPNEPLAKHTTFKIGGPADFFVAVDETERLVDLLRYVEGEGIDYFILGGGSNMLVSDEGFRGVVVRVKSQKSKVKSPFVIADAGCITVELAHASIKAGLTGFEWGVGVPGTIGGAARGNAGAMGGEIKHVVDKVEVYRAGEVIELNNQECEFGYRESVFKHNRDVILRVWLRLKKAGENWSSADNEKKGGAVAGADGKEGLKKALEFLKYRNESQPQGWASTGCIFKNIDLAGPHGEGQRLLLLQKFDSDDEKVREFLRREKISAGWLVEQAGMKGVQVGQAKVSERHGNFIVNLGGARAADVLTLIEQIKAQVYDKFGIGLEEEIQLVNF